jgi:hypothetical protein
MKIGQLIAQVNLKQIQQNSGLDVTGTFDYTSPIGFIVSEAIPWIFIIAGMLLLVYLIFGGLQLMLSGGEPKNAQAAKTHITNALVGFIVIFIAFWVTQLFGLIFGLQGITNVFGGMHFCAINATC